MGNKADFTPDVIVVGTGACGSLVIDRMIRDGYRVLVLERGLDEPYAPPTMENVWRSTTASSEEDGRIISRNTWLGDNVIYEFSDGLGDGTEYGYDDLAIVENTSPFFAFHYNMRLGYGGSSAIWGGRVWRFYDSDFSTKANFGYGRDWPVSASEMAPYYAATEQLMRVSGTSDGNWPFPSNYATEAFEPTYLDKAVQPIFHPHFRMFSTANAAINADPINGGCVGSKTCNLLCPNNSIFRHYQKLLEPHRGKEALKIEFDCLVTSLEVDNDGFISSIRHRNRAGDSTLTEVPRGTLVFLCGNTIENLRIALNSPYETQRPVANSAGLLGKYFATHGAVTRELVTANPLKPGRSRPSTSAGLDPDFGTRRDQFNSYMLEVRNYNVWRGSSERAFSGYRGSTRHWGRSLFNEAQVLNRTTSITMVFEIEMQERNRVNLSEARDSWGMRLAQVDFELSARDNATFAHLNSLFDQMSAHPDCVEFNPHGYGLNGNHPLGGFVSSNSKSDGVTDKVGRSHDHPNLYFTGGGLFNSTSCFNPTLTITANTLRMLDSNPMVR